MLKGLKYFFSCKWLLDYGLIVRAEKSKKLKKEQGKKSELHLVEVYNSDLTKTGEYWTV